MLLRSFLFKSCLITGFIVLCLVTSGIALAVFKPFSPGNIIFPIQDFAEQQTFLIFTDRVERSNYALDLFEQRIKDLVAQTGTSYELVAMQFVDEALDQATTTASLVPQEQGEAIRARLLTLAQLVYEKLKLLTVVPVDNQTLYMTFQTKVETLILMVGKPGVENNELSRVASIRLDDPGKSGDPATIAMAASGLIPFPPGSAGAVHAFYPLVGQHVLAACNTCHNAGKYLDTPNTCSLCHILDLPDSHYAGDCTACHTALAWDDIHVDHAAFDSTDCLSCHQKDLPADHYSGDCSSCHGTQAWSQVTFNHNAAGVTDCSSCHSQDAPANHYAGQCSSCHNSSSWSGAQFNHSGNANCISCHSSDAPQNHNNGQCSTCHSTNQWNGASQSHNGLTDCISCHANDAPGDTTPGNVQSAIHRKLDGQTITLTIQV